MDIGCLKKDTSGLNEMFVCLKKDTNVLDEMFVCLKKDTSELNFDIIHV